MTERNEDEEKVRQSASLHEFVSEAYPQWYVD